MYYFFLEIRTATGEFAYSHASSLTFTYSCPSFGVWRPRLISIILTLFWVVAFFNVAVIRSHSTGMPCCGSHCYKINVFKIFRWLKFLKKWTDIYCILTLTFMTCINGYLWYGWLCYYSYPQKSFGMFMLIHTCTYIQWIIHVKLSKNNHTFSGVSSSLCSKTIDWILFSQISRQKSLTVLSRGICVT